MTLSMELKNIKDIVSEKIAILKKYESGKKKHSEPEYNPIYLKCYELKERIELHAELDKEPVDLMKKRAPYEDDRQYEYRKKNFNNVTMPYMMKAIGKLNRIMNKSNYSIEWKQDEHKQYFEKEIPIFGSLTDYFEQVVVTEKILDPNALLVHKPMSIPMREELVEGQQVFIVDDTQPIDPIPVIIECDDVIDYVPGVYAMIELEEKSEVKVGDQIEKEGIIFEFYDTENIYRIKQYGQKHDYTFTEPELYYSHKLGFLPCEKLRGIPKSEDGHIYYWSYFIYAIPLLDVALYEYSNLDMSVITQMFPQRSEWVEKCTNTGCVDGYMHEWIDGVEKINRCPSCLGTGKAQPVGPMQVKQFTIPDALQPDDPIKSVPFPGVAYVAPPVEPLDFVYTKFKQDVADAFGFLNIDISNTDVKGSETALGKQIDREELFAFLLRISNEVFTLLSFSIECIGKMRFINSFEQPTIKAPTSFAIRSEYDLTEELIESKKAQIPDVATRQMLREYFVKRFNSEKNIDSVIDLIFYTDRLITSNVVDISARLANGTAAKWEAILHDSIYTLIDEKVFENPNFFALPLNEQKAQLVEKAKELATQIAPEPVNTTQRILDIANNASA